MSSKTAVQEKIQALNKKASYHEEDEKKKLNDYRKIKTSRKLYIY